MIRHHVAAALVIAAGLGTLVYAQPKLSVPAEVKPTGDYAVMQPAGDAVAVVYVGLSGVDPFPSGLLKDARAFVLPTRGLKDGTYKFAAVGANEKGEQVRVDFVVQVGVPGPNPPPVIPPETPAPKPAPGYYLAVVRPNGPADADFTKVMSYREWDKLREAGHTVRDFTFNEACAGGFCPPVGTGLPCVMILKSDPNGKTGKIVRGPLPMPPVPDHVPKLLDGLK